MIKEIKEAFPNAVPSDDGEEIKYYEGVLDFPLNHERKLFTYISYLKEICGDKKFFIKISDEEEHKTLQQLKLIHGLFRLLDMSNCMPERIDNEDKVKEYFKIKMGMIDKYGYVSDENRLIFVRDKAEVPQNKLAIPFTTSLSKVSKKALKELIDYTLNFCDKQNQYGNLGSQTKKYLEIREQLDQNSIERLRG